MAATKVECLDQLYWSSGSLTVGLCTRCDLIRVARTVYLTVYDRIFGDFPAMNTVYTPHKCGSGQP